MFSCVNNARFMSLLRISTFYGVFVLTGCISQYVYNSIIINACIGRNITLTCNSQGQSSAKFEWNYNGKVVEAKDYAISQTKVTSTLVIHEYKTQNAGLYECKELYTGGKVVTRQQFKVSTATSFNISTSIIHRQYLDNHLIFINIKHTPDVKTWNTDHKTWNTTITTEYRCTSDSPLVSQSQQFCVARWQPIPLCSVNRSKSDVYYSCFLQADKVMIFSRYEVRAAVKLPCEWSNETSSFMVDIPTSAEQLEQFSAKAVNHNTVILSWKKVTLLRDVEKFKPENIVMVMEIIKSHGNITSRQSTYLKPWDTSMKLHGFKQLTNYSFNASYHFIVSGLILLPSPIVGPVTVEIPERVIRSKPATNNSCHEMKNSTGKSYFNISWRAPDSLHNVGDQLLTKITLQYGGSQRFYSKYQQKGTSSFILYEAVASMVVDVEICNEAGCSSKVKISCSLKEAHTEKENSNPMYIVGYVVAAICAISFALFFLFYCKKRKITKVEFPEEDPPAIGPRGAEHPYDEPLENPPVFEVLPDYKSDRSSTKELRCSDDGSNQDPVISSLEDRTDFGTYLDHVSQNGFHSPLNNGTIENRGSENHNERMDILQNSSIALDELNC